MSQTPREIFNAIYKKVRRMGDKDAALDSIRTYYVKNKINKSKRDAVYQYSRETKHRMSPTRWIILLLREAREELKAVPAASSRSSSPASMSSRATFAAAAAAPPSGKTDDPYGLGPAKVTPQSKSSSSDSDSDAGHYKRTNTKHKRNRKLGGKSKKIRRKVKGKSKKIRRKVKGKSKKIRFRK
jgi:hypothetical protein